jgi:diguanylate cyclase (GGDEF)-like protein/PAS domain S-box-containing protein
VGWSDEVIENTNLAQAALQAADRIAITDAGGKIQFVNPAFPKITGHAIQHISERKRIAQDVIDSQALAQSTIDALSSTICVLNEAGTIIAVNQSWKDFAETNRKVHPERDLAGSHVHDNFGEGVNYLEVCDRVIGPDAEEAAAVARGIRSVLCGDSEQYTREYSCDSPDEKRWFIGKVTRFFTHGLTRVVIEHINISERKQSEALLRETADGLATAIEALRLSEDHYRTVFQTSIDGIAISQMSDGVYLDVNKAFLDLMGFAREDIIGNSSLKLNFWVDSSVRQDMVAALRKHSCFRDVKTQYVKKSGDIIWLTISGSTIEILGVPCILSVLSDISAAKIAEDEIRNLVFYDTLTHLPNRRLLVDRLRKTMEASMQSHRMGALLLVVLDNFKIIKDTLGHQTGDLLLQEVARRLRSCVRETDTVARLGGDEFVVMLEDLGKMSEGAATHAGGVAEKILFTVSRPYLLARRECHSTSSIGIIVFGDRPVTANEVLQRADIALDQAKAAGRNTMCFFTPALQVAVNARAALEDDLHRALKTDQFVLYYQPQVDHGHLIGAEALVRWKHPQRGLVPPDKFIPLAEATGLIVPLGSWVLETACAQIAKWADRKETSDLTVAVNISAREFRQLDFVERVLAVLDRTRANPFNLKMELTESMLVDNVEATIQTMTKLQSYGLKFSLDDFGTGFSSLSYLRRLPLDQFKIDRSFVRDMLVDATSGAIAQTIISLGKVMGLPVIAEGVETQEQRDFLTGLGCHSFQGYLFGRPLPIEEFQLLLPVFASQAGSTMDGD